jgi:hypothetical protein
MLDALHASLTKRHEVSAVLAQLLPAKHLRPATLSGASDRGHQPRRARRPRQSYEAVEVGISTVFRDLCVAFQCK